MAGLGTICLPSCSSLGLLLLSAVRAVWDWIIHQTLHFADCTHLCSLLQKDPELLSELLCNEKEACFLGPVQTYREEADPPWKAFEELEMLQKARNDAFIKQLIP